MIPLFPSPLTPELSDNTDEKQTLRQVVDDLNCKFGIIHQDIAPRNLSIDPATDDLIVFDFSISVRPGLRKARYHLGEATGELKERNDVKGVVVTVHEILTRDPRYKAESLHYLDETELLAGPEKWVKHPDVELEPGLGAVDYFDELMRWVRARRARPIHVSHRRVRAPRLAPRVPRPAQGADIGIVRPRRGRAVQPAIHFVAPSALGTPRSLAPAARHGQVR